MKFATFVLCLLTLGTLSLAKSAHAQGNYATVSMGPFTNSGSLSPNYYLDYPGSYAGQNQTSVVATLRAGNRHRSQSGTTYAELRNNTSSAVTLSGYATLELRASATCLLLGGAHAKLTLGVTAEVSASDADQEPPSDIKSQQFSVTDLQPGDVVPLDGTFLVTADVS